MKKLSVLLYAALVLVFVFAGCGSDDEEPAAPPLKLKLISAYKLAIPEPSGIAFDYSDTTLWIVSDHNSTVYKTDLTGNKIDSFLVEGEDLEGITCVQQSYIAVALERIRQVQYLFRTGELRFKKDLHLTGKENNGIEGIGYSNKTHTFYIVNEKHPKLLLGYNDNMTELFRDTLKYAKDLSGVCFDDSSHTLWLVSDDSRSVYLLNEYRQLIGAFPLNIKQLEGIAYDASTKRLYLVSDLEESLYVYELVGEPDLEKREEPAHTKETEKKAEH